MLTAWSVAFVAALFATPLVREGARRLGVLDHPGPRSSHRTPTPRVGGMAIVVGVALAAVTARVPQDGHRDMAALFAGGALVALVGLADDLFGLRPLPRLLVHAMAAILVVRVSGGLDRVPLPAPLDLEVGPIVGAALAVLWIVAATNLYNFMDGIDGLASLQGVVTAGALALALTRLSPGPAVVAAAVAGSTAAFLVYNWAPASVFLGDVGSGLLGYTLAALALLAPAERRSEAVVLVAASLFLFLADTTACLLSRMGRGESWFEAHREHLYQRWVDTGAKHGAVAGWLGSGAVATTGAALAGWWTGASAWYGLSLALGAVLWGLERAVVRRREAVGGEIEDEGDDAE